MSNKTLVISIICVILAAAAIVGFARMRNSEDVAEDNPSQTAGLDQNQPQNSAPEQGNNNAINPATTTPQDKGDSMCQRNFDKNKLDTEKVSISGRQAEISVKGYGKITLEFFDKDAPKAVENFLRLANAGYYDCVTFHRVAKGFVIQGGDPTGTGSGGDSAFGREFEDELNPDAPSYKEGYKKGVLAMANRGPNTNTSQFFVMLDDLPLDNNYTIFGKVTSGLDVVDRIGQVQIIPQLGPTDGKPVTPVVMESVKITK